MSVLDRELKTNVRDILSMVACGFSYGHRNQIFDHFAANMCETLTEEEIEAYARELASGKGYTEEDYENTKRDLMGWFQKSFENGKAI
jgi:hypothetical protein